jgi:DNA repair protein RadC
MERTEPVHSAREVLELLRAMLQPNPGDQIKSPTDAAGLLMLDMSALDQEHLRTVLLDTKNRVQTITTV